MNLRDKAALRAKCPFCGAQPNERCRSMDMRRPGELLDSVHRSRLWEAGE